MDDFTRRHLRAWLERHFTDEDERERAFAAMTLAHEDDPAYWDSHGWERLCEEAYPLI